MLRIGLTTALVLVPLAFLAGMLLQPQNAPLGSVLLRDRRERTTPAPRPSDAPAPRLSVAYAAILPYGAMNKSSWRDGLAVLALSLRRAANRSAHRAAFLAILPDSLPRQEEERRVLALLGLEARFVPVPVPLDQVRTAFARRALSKVLGQFEQLKYYGAAFTEYDRVVILDADTMFLSPIDELFREEAGIRMHGTYAHDLDIRTSVFPPINSGFMVYIPDKRDFDRIKDIVRRGDFRGGTGWDGSGTGYTYGTGSQGVLSYYYNQVHPGVEGFNPTPPQKGKDLPGLNFTKQPNTSRFRPLDRSVYNVVVGPLLVEAAGLNRTDASRVKVFHFTGKCQKPWKCHRISFEICEEMTRRWWSFRAELAKTWGGDAKRCEPRVGYKALPLPT